MQTAKFYGHSDDIVYVKGVKGEDEYHVSGDEPLVATFNLGGRMRVHAIYDDGGCWAFAVGLVAEGVPLPADWAVDVESDGYSAVLKVVVPDDVVVFQEKRKRS